MLINYSGKYYDMSTVAHELGHAMHSFHSNRAQPFHLAGYETFVAEVASQFNEDLLLEYILKQVTDREARIADAWKLPRDASRRRSFGRRSLRISSFRFINWRSKASR